MLEPYVPPADSIDFSQLLSLQLKLSDTCITPTIDSVLCCLLLSTHATAGGSTSLGLPALQWLLKHLKSVSADDVSCYNAPPQPQGTHWLEPTLAFAREGVGMQPRAQSIELPAAQPANMELQQFHMWRGGRCRVSEGRMPTALMTVL